MISQEAKEWERVVKKGALIVVPGRNSILSNGDSYFQKTDRGSYMFRIDFNTMMGEVIASQSGDGMACFSDIEPTDDTQAIRVLGSNKTKTVLFVEPVDSMEP